MTPEQVAASYDQIADRWLDLSTYGFAQIGRAVAFVKRKGVALDVGCGAGRCLDLLARHSFTTDGIDLSPAMIALARHRHPEARLFHADICRWELPRSYDLIVAWDSVWHVPLDRQEMVLTKLCRKSTSTRQRNHPHRPVFRVPWASRTRDNHEVPDAEQGDLHQTRRGWRLGLIASATAGEGGCRSPRRSRCRSRR